MLYAICYMLYPAQPLHTSTRILQHPLQALVSPLVLAAHLPVESTRHTVIGGGGEEGKGG
jgi:hypothetical protein